MRAGVAAIRRVRTHGSTSGPGARLFWVLVRGVRSDWRRHLHLVKPETVIRWHRRGWRWYGQWRSRARLARHDLAHLRARGPLPRQSPRRATPRSPRAGAPKPAQPWRWRSPSRPSRLRLMARSRTTFTEGDLGTDRLEPREAEWLWKTMGVVTTSAAQGRTDAAIAAAGLQVDECIDVATEWGEWAEEQAGEKQPPASSRLPSLARARALRHTIRTGRVRHHARRLPLVRVRDDRQAKPSGLPLVSRSEHP